MLKRYPTTIIPTTQMKINKLNNFILIAFFNMINEGRLKVVTAIMKLKILPRSAPLESKASAIGIVPNISAYIGTPTIVASTTPNGLLRPRIDSTQASGIQLWINAPMATPIKI